MKHLAVICSLFASACFGTIDDGPHPQADDDPVMDPPPPPSDVRIEVHDAVGPLDGLAVVFLDANDTVVADVMTDAQGAAVAKLSTGSVTVIRPAAATTPQAPGGNLASVYTYVGVKAGDRLDLALATVRPSMPVVVQVSVPVTDQKSLVRINTPCGSGAGIAPIIEVELDGCGSETDFYVMDLGEERSAFIKRAPIAPTVDLSAETYRGALTTSLSITNAPTGAAVSIEERIETDLFRPAYTTGALPVSPGNPLDVTLPDLPGTEQLVFATVSYDGAAQIISSHDAYPGGPASVDLAAAMIIAPSNPKLAGDTLSWTEQGSGAPDIVIPTLTNATVQRYIAAPYSSASLKIPRLPAAHDAFNVTANDTATIALARVGGGFDGVRPRVFAGPLAPMGGGVTVAVASALGPEPK